MTERPKRTAGWATPTLAILQDPWKPWVDTTGASSTKSSPPMATTNSIARVLFFMRSKNSARRGDIMLLYRTGALRCPIETNRGNRRPFRVPLQHLAMESCPASFCHPLLFSIQSGSTDRDNHRQLPHHSIGMLLPNRPGTSGTDQAVKETQSVANQPGSGAEPSRS